MVVLLPLPVFAFASCRFSIATSASSSSILAMAAAVRGAGAGETFRGAGVTLRAAETLRFAMVETLPVTLRRATAGFGARASMVVSVTPLHTCRHSATPHNRHFGGCITASPSSAQHSHRTATPPNRQHAKTSAAPRAAHHGNSRTTTASANPAYPTPAAARSPV
jgi:hypothetical protein